MLATKRSSSHLHFTYTTGIHQECPSEIEPSVLREIFLSGIRLVEIPAKAYEMQKCIGYIDMEDWCILWYTFGYYISTLLSIEERCYEISPSFFRSVPFFSSFNPAAYCLLIADELAKCFIENGV